ncbi:uncharacterized protein CEXT_420541 [Caerostris extrusa]|uniref:Uncharacterized protein n=1 Tax=Caerostris extrusa TaxID=172846 RepID=A0AAV4V487_CAEEX|nr:uncharacterized protein CEXT_420541 [Caerostris extrusa]
MLMCDKHLEEVYGLVLQHKSFEFETNYQIVGGFLKPTEGVFFKTNTVIIPTRKFFDVTFRPEEVSNTHHYEMYTMNPRILEFWQRALNRHDKQVEDRYKLETARNLSESPKNVNLGPHEGQDKLSKNALTLITSKLTISEAQIEKQIKHLDKFTLFMIDKEITLADSGLSTNMQFFYSNCHFSEHKYAEGIALDYLMFNAIYVKDVGLVAVEDISHPSPIVITGSSTGTPMFYNALCLCRRSKKISFLAK